MEVTAYGSDKDCRSPADNDKHQIKSELLFARQPDLAAVHTSLPFPLIISTETARRSSRNPNFFRKRGILENFGRLFTNDLKVYAEPRQQSDSHACGRSRARNRDAAICQHTWSAVFKVVASKIVRLVIYYDHLRDDKAR